MAIQLLHCCICPKQPDFSDTSHLLTHVSSKGHLSHLHKLQVRSHQETSAGRQLAYYNQWFADHNVAHMLSERMQQKEMKQARKRADNNRRSNAVKRDERQNVDPIFLPADNRFKQEPRDYADYVLDTHRSSSYPCLDRDVYEPTQHVSSFPAYLPPATIPWAHGGKRPAELIDSSPERATFTTPEAAKLKGIIWPGMDMFDSANQETQRKRNQKKDISVLEKMQIMSQLVEPLETVCSPKGTVKKRRHMDDLEDDSPVEGESPLIKQSSKRKRKALSKISGNVPGFRRQKSKPTRSSKREYVTPTKGLPSGIRLRNNHRHGQSHRTVAETENYRQVGPSECARTGFPVFNDASTASTSPRSNRLLSNPFLMKGHEGYQLSKPLSFPVTPWLQPTQRASPLSDPFKAYQPAHLLPETCSDVTTDKENFNPLSWSKGLIDMASSPMDRSYDTFDNFDDGLGTLAEVYAFTKNPLSMLH